MPITRRGFVAGVATATTAAALPGGAFAQKAPFVADWDSLIGGYRTPAWFADAKFGIWAHWSAQCVPESGDWYARRMYIEGDRCYDHHLKTYGHPSRTGFIDIQNRWRAEAWEPDRLLDLYKKAGAKYFVALASHHDNLDAFASAHHPWNTLRVGPKRDIIGGWEKAARKAGLKFGVSNHSAHAWHWFQTAYAYDTRGPMKGVRYDGYRLRAADGAGTWWQGLDPQDLYCGEYFVPPDGIQSPAAMEKWRETRDRAWLEYQPWGPRGAAFAKTWLARQNDLVAKYRPDYVFLDNAGLPFGELGLQAVADYYNLATGWYGAPDVAITTNHLDDFQARGMVNNVERGFSAMIRPEPWQTGTCIGDWHYDRGLYESKGYKTAEQVVQRLCDVVSKNGNLLVSIPVRGDGSIDSEEEKILADLARWIAINGDGIYATRPWRVFGEGPFTAATGAFGEIGAKSYTAQDVRITAGGVRGASGLNLFLLGKPSAEVRIACLGRRAMGGTIERVTPFGGGDVRFVQDDDALSVTLSGLGRTPFVPGLRLEGRGLAARAAI